MIAERYNLDDGQLDEYNWSGEVNIETINHIKVKAGEFEYKEGMLIMVPCIPKRIY